MLLKWIICDVAINQRDDFAHAQTYWSALAAVDGFFVQIGGWEEGANRRACILAMWETSGSYRRFMSKHHDNIFARSGQDNTVQRTTISLYELVTGTSGSWRLHAQGALANAALFVSKWTPKADVLGRPRERVILDMSRMTNKTTILGREWSGDESQEFEANYFVASLWLDYREREKHAKIKSRFEQAHDTPRTFWHLTNDYVVHLEPLWCVYGRSQ